LDTGRAGMQLALLDRETPEPTKLWTALPRKEETMMSWMRWILVGAVLAVFNGCGLSASETSSAPKESVTSAADTTVLLWTDTHPGYRLDCADQCGRPGCDCLAAERCPDAVDVDRPCTTQGAECDIVDNISYTTVRCLSRTISTPPAGPTWKNVSGAIESCADRCGTISCGCVRNRCATTVVPDAPCSPVGAACNLIEGQDFVMLRCAN
jgi:hypothetical protein